MNIYLGTVKAVGDQLEWKAFGALPRHDPEQQISQLLFPQMGQTRYIKIGDLRKAGFNVPEPGPDLLIIKQGPDGNLIYEKPLVPLGSPFFAHSIVFYHLARCNVIRVITN